MFAFEGAALSGETLHDWYSTAGLTDERDSYPDMIYVLKEGALDLKRFSDGVFGHRFLMGEQSDERKARSLSIFLQSIRKALEVRAGIESNPFEVAALNDMSWSRQYVRLGVGWIDPEPPNQPPQPTSGAAGQGQTESAVSAARG